jgi:phage tail sheath protein FI
MATYKTPDVYIEEISVLPPSVAEVETAVPAFIGYTEKANKNGINDLILKPTKIFSLKEYEQYYGFPAADKITLNISTESDGSFKLEGITEPTLKYLLYYSMKMFFDNGGGQCYIISVGTYQDPAVINLNGGADDTASVTSKYGLSDGLNAVKSEDEPTLIVIPEAVNLLKADYQTLVQAVLSQCNQLQDRFAIFDLFEGDKTLEPSVQSNRSLFGNNFLKYGAAYYPFIKTTLNYHINSVEDNVEISLDGGTPSSLSSLQSSNPALNTALYNYTKSILKDYFVILPPSAAVAGAYAATDNNRGVWKAPANISLANVIEPVIKIDNTIQDGLNVDATTGKSINAIRAFMGKGTLVWGARTLAGNDNEWRYISVRRFFNTVEESVKKSTYWAVFEPNDANTWVKVRGMIEAYLVQKWREGALAGATPKEAFFVRCGLGTTMDSQDILEGRMNVEIGMAVVRPAEFIILKFSHKLQTA